MKTSRTDCLIEVLHRIRALLLIAEIKNYPFNELRKVSLLVENALTSETKEGD